MNTTQMKAHIASGGIDARLAYIYGEAAVAAQKARYSAAIDEFAAIYGADREITLYSVAGRSELLCHIALCARRKNTAGKHYNKSQ